MKKFILFSLTILLITQAISAKPTTYNWGSKKHRSKNINSVFESNLIQFAMLEKANKSLTTIPRYTYFFNLGTEINGQVDRNFQLFTGLNMKNIGLIHKQNDSMRTKHRVYTVGAPLGFKIHSNNNKVVFKSGIDLSFAVNYKRKVCVNDKKTKTSKWFSDETALFFPSLFAGLAVHGVTVSANYYLNNFFNPLLPSVSGMDARLLTLGIGLNMDYKGSKKKPKKEDAPM